MHLIFRHEKSFFDSPISKKIYNLNDCYATQIGFSTKPPLGVYHQPQVVWNQSTALYGIRIGGMESPSGAWNQGIALYGIRIGGMESPSGVCNQGIALYGIRPAAWNHRQVYGINRRLHKNPSRSVCFWHFLVCFYCKRKCFFLRAFFLFFFAHPLRLWYHPLRAPIFLLDILFFL